MKRQNSRPNCTRTVNDEIINANYDLDDEQTLTDLSVDKTRALLGSLCVVGSKRSLTT